MKAMKKVTAIILTLCLMIGLPLSVDVAATGAADDNTVRLAQALVVPEYWGTDLDDADKTLALYFTGGPLTVETDKLSVKIVIANVNNEWLPGEMHAEKWGVTLDAVLERSDQLKAPNNWTVRLTGSLPLSWVAESLRSEFTSDLDTFSELLKLAQLGSTIPQIAQNGGCRLKLRLVDKGGTPGDGVVNGISDTDAALTANLTAMAENGNGGGNYDCAEINVITQDEALMMRSAIYDAQAKTLNVSFTPGTQITVRDKAELYGAIRVVNSRGMIMGYDETTKTFHTHRSNGNGLCDVFVASTSTATGEFTSTSLPHDWQHEKIQNYITWVAEHNASVTDEADKLRVVYLLEETYGKTVEGRGEASYNRYVDTAWNTQTGAPMLANYTDSTAGVYVNDVAMAELIPADQLKDQSVTMQSVTAYTNSNGNDLLVVKFSEAIASMPSAGIALTAGETTLNVTGWKKNDTAGSCWVGQIEGEISALTGEITFSIADQNGVKGNRQVDCVVSADATKHLYADDSADIAAERAVCTVVNGGEVLTVTDISVYREKYVVVTFSESVTIDSQKAYIGIRITDNGEAKTLDKDTGAGVNNGLAMWGLQLKPYGNTGNKFVSPINAPYNDITWSTIEAIEEHNSSTGYKAQLVFEDDNALDANDRGTVGGNGFIEAVTATADSNKMLVANYSWNWGERCTVDPDFPTPINLNSAVVIDDTTLQVTFSDPIVWDYHEEMDPYIGLRIYNTASMKLKEWNGGAWYDVSSTGRTAVDPDENGASKVWNLTFADGRLRAALAANGGGGLPEGCQIGLCIEDEYAADVMAGYIDAVTTYDGTNVLKANANCWNNRYWAAITNGTDTDVTPVTVESVVITGEGTVEVTFSTPVQINGSTDMGHNMGKGNGFAGLRVAIDNHIDGSQLAAASFKAKEDSIVDGYADVWVMTFTKNSVSAWAIDNYFSTGKVDTHMLCFTYEEEWDGHNGTIGHVKDRNGNPLASSRALTKNYNEGAYIPIDNMDYFGDTSVLDTPLTVTGATMISRNQVVVSFSEPITILEDIKKPYISMRLVDENDTLVWATHDENNAVVIKPFGSGSAMQWYTKGYTFNNEEHTELLITFRDDMDFDLFLTMEQFPEQFAGYTLKVGIEESNTNDGNFFAGNGKVHQIRAVSNPLKQLNGTAAVVSGRWDGAYVAFTPLSEKTPITVVDGQAVITGENELTFHWSESVNNGSQVGYFRWVNPETGLMYGNVQVGAGLRYVDEARTTVCAYVYSRNSRGIRNLKELLDPEEGSELWTLTNVTYPDGVWQLCVMETYNASPGLVETFAGVSGKAILTNNFIAGSDDGVYMNITGNIIEGELSLTSAKAISDTKIVASFSAPVAILSDYPYAAVRLYSANDKLLFLNPVTGEYTETEQCYDADGNRIYKLNDEYTTDPSGKAVSNIPMQWSGWGEWYKDDHSAIVYTISGGKDLPARNITDILAYDWNTVSEGAYVMFSIEESGKFIGYDSHINNITLASDPLTALDGNFFPHDRDSVRAEIELGYSPNKVNARSVIINDTQIRVTFSRAVQMVGKPFMAVRLIDKEGELMWSAEVNTSVPYQWYGNWEWENDSHTSLIWTMNGGSLYGADNLYEIVNYADALSQFKGKGTFMFCIEELPVDGERIGYYNGLVDNVVSLDGANHLNSTYSKYYDGILTELDGNLLAGPELTVESVKALDDQTVEIKFSEAVSITDEDGIFTMGVRYLTESGDSDVLTDGKTAYFKGNWEFKGDSKDTIIWTLDSPYADNLSDILNYNGKFKWNKQSRAAFVIVNDKEHMAPTWSNRINGITTADGYRMLVANFCTAEMAQVQFDMEICYDLPAPEASGQDQVQEIVYTTNYLLFIIIAAAVAILVPVTVLILRLRKKRS